MYQAGSTCAQDADTLARVGITAYRESRYMKKIAKATKAQQRTLTTQDLAAVRGRHNGTIVVENLVQNGVGETDKTGSNGTG
jgi:hypothetical protein